MTEDERGMLVVAASEGIAAGHLMHAITSVLIKKGALSADDARNITDSVLLTLENSAAKVSTLGRLHDEVYRLARQRVEMQMRLLIGPPPADQSPE